MPKPRILAHICCAPDAAYVIGLLKVKFKVTGFFYNPNIHPADEYQLRLEETRKVAAKLGADLIEEVYDDARWFMLTEKFKDEPEKGRRCDICYALRLNMTARRAVELGFDSFTTIMSLSPWKKAAVLNRMGQMFGCRFKIAFFEADFKKRDGFRKSIALSKDLGLYRQDYCGCLFSLRDKKREATQSKKKE